MQTPPENEQEPAPPKPRVLVVEPNEEVLEKIRRDETLSPFDMIYTSDVASAMEVIQARMPDAFVVALRLPEMSSREFVARLRQYPNFKEVHFMPVIHLGFRGTDGVIHADEIADGMWLSFLDPMVLAHYIWRILGNDKIPDPFKTKPR